MIKLVRKFFELKPDARFLIEVVTCGMFGFFCAVVFALSGTHRNNAAEIIATLFLIQAATGSLGTLGGFLFGIPRSQQDVETNGRKIRYSPNTNLEQVSDWLTKILVGIGLTQFGSIISGIDNLATSIAADSVSLQDAKTIILASIVYDFVLGFFGSYVMTRMVMAKAFLKADAGKSIEESTAPKLVNLEFELTELSKKEQQELLHIISEKENNTEVLLDRNLDTNDELSQIYTSLQQRHLIQLKGGETMESGKTVELTPIAIKSMAEIKNELLSLNPSILNQS